jgi:hypothetical protein
LDLTRAKLRCKSHKTEIFAEKWAAMSTKRVLVAEGAVIRGFAEESPEL